MTNTPSISVIMPVFNAERYLPESIESILGQSFSNFEFLIFDDGSTDDSVRIIDGYKDERIKLFRSVTNQGYVTHLNRGLKAARGKYIARMDADDIALSQRFERQVAYMEAHPEVSVCGTWFEMFDGAASLVAHPETHEAIFTRLAICGSAIGHPTVMIRSSTLSDNNIAYPEDLSPAEDYAFWCDIALYGKFYNIPEVLLRYRVHGQNVSVTKKTMQDEAVDVTRRVMIARVGNLDIEKDSAKVQLLFEFLFVGERDRGFSDSELTVINSFLSSLVDNRSIDRDELRSVLGKRRLFVYENASAHPLFYKIYTALRRLKI